ncbi:putative amidoligase enzyme [Rhodovulum bhavnagarense]|uniref:Putative amidoligase enzyme n=1 Tax=Rhodovulum bhavnagarense TaxID=992286 RepID=A0A4R2RHR2_9RHOB|nr:amidoligase family protein [Rhodovulum bhavnagarense]TCP61979.1 putative amidoligase enzyme [Rhodovulum bhavnagarense]
MDGITALVPRDRFLPLSPRMTAKGFPRRVGVEIEFGGLTETEAAQQVVAALGGRIGQIDAHELSVQDTTLGDIGICLDTAWRDKAGNALADLGLDLSRAVVPVEIVTPPLAPDDMPELENLRGHLCKAGATGSRKGMFLGYGLHLNPEIADETAGAILPVLRAFALLEDWLRNADPIDPSRRVMPFIEPYPRRFVDRLAGEARTWSLDALVEAYLADTPTRNRGLDLLPCLRHLDEDRLCAALGDEARSVSARPAFHYRLPDCRIDEIGWRIAYEWNRWAMVEALAARPMDLDRLADDWLDYRGQFISTRPDWLAHVETRLDELALWAGP